MTIKLQGQRPLALEQFQRCRETLLRELDIEPVWETWQLYRRIRDGQEPTPLPGIGGDSQASLQVATTRLRHTLGALESTLRALQVVIVEFVRESESAQGGTVHPEQG